MVEAGHIFPFCTPFQPDAFQAKPVCSSASPTHLCGLLGSHRDAPCLLPDLYSRTGDISGRTPGSAPRGDSALELQDGGPIVFGTKLLFYPPSAGGPVSVSPLLAVKGPARTWVQSPWCLPGVGPQPGCGDLVSPPTLKVLPP